jgi:hypothetical protein
MRRLLLILTALACALCAALPAAAGARSAPPQGFFGVDAGGPLFNPDVDLGRQMDLMVGSGVQSIRVVFNWSEAQPYPNEAAVPADQRGSYQLVGGVPTSFAATDRIVSLASARGLAVLPTVLFAPSWDAGRNPAGFSPPARSGPYGAYLKALIGRYGPHGSFWRGRHRKLAIRAWQIWNEPNISQYWPQPFAPGYVKLLRAAHSAIKHADRGARVVLGALTNTAWKYLGQIDRIRGARKLYDVISVNGFTSTPGRVIEFLSLMRRAADRLGNSRKPLLATELSFPSAKGHPVQQNDWDTTRQGQARDVAKLLPLLAANRRSLNLAGFFYYTWVTQENLDSRDDFNFAGLLDYQGNGRITAKPALGAYRKAALRLEGCRRKGSTATRCIR